MKPRRKSSRTAHRYLLWAALGLVMLVLGVALYGYLWVQNYLKSDRFGALVAKELGSATHAEATLEGFQWNNPDANIASLTLKPKSRQGWSLITAESLQAGLDWSAVRRGVWDVPLISIGSLQMDLEASSKTSVHLPESETSTPPAASAPDWLKRWLPKRTEIGQVRVENFSVIPSTSTGVSAQELRVTAKPGSQSGLWLLKSQGGQLQLTSVKEPFRLEGLNARVDEQAFTLHDGTAKWVGNSHLTARGTLPFGKGKSWGFQGQLSDLGLREVLDASWRERVNGTLTADYEVTPNQLKAHVKMVNFVVQGLPVLDRVAEFTRTERFRHLTFDVATADVLRKGEQTEVRNLILQCSGLLRLEGKCDLDGKTMDGDFYVGVTSDALRWIPGSQSQVFTETREGSPGLVWTKVKLSGPISQPREDLSNRLLAAAGKALLDVPLNAAGVGVGVGGRVIEETTGTAGKVLETGADLLKGLVPLFGK